MTTRPIEIASPLGRLAGVLHAPDAPAPGAPAILMPPVGMSDRAGPMQLYVRLARRLCDAGYHVLRYDGVGAGESDGYPPSIELLRCLEAIEAGERADEIVAAAELLERDVRAPSLVVGLGAAAVQAAHLAQRAPHLVAGVLAIGAPATRTRVGALPLRPTGWLGGESAGARIATSLRRRFGIEPDAHDGAWEVLQKLAYRVTSGAPGRPRGGGIRATSVERLATQIAAGLERADEDVARETWTALVALRARGAPVALVYGEHDPALRAYEDKVRRVVPEIDVVISRRIVDGAGHACADAASFEALAALVLEFLKHRALWRVEPPPRSSQRPGRPPAARNEEASDE